MANVLPLVEFTVTVALANFLLTPYSVMVTVPFIIGSPFEPAFLALVFEVNCKFLIVELLLWEVIVVLFCVVAAAEVPQMVIINAKTKTMRIRFLYLLIFHTP